MGRRLGNYYIGFIHLMLRSLWILRSGSDISVIKIGIVVFVPIDEWPPCTRKQLGGGGATQSKVMKQNQNKINQIHFSIYFYWHF